MILDRLFDASIKLGRVLAQALPRRSFESAGPTHPLGRYPINAAMPSPARAGLASLPTMRARCRWLVANVWQAESVANAWVTNLVSDGPSVSSPHPVETVARDLEAKFERWFYGPTVDIEGGDAVSVLTRTVRALVADGEAFWRFIVTERGELRVQMIAPEQVDAPARDLADGGRIEAGIEFNALGERVAYHVRRDDRLRSEPLRIPADEICHVFERRYAGQLRGIPWLAPVATRIIELDGLEDAVAMKARVSALFCAFIRDVDGTAAAGSATAAPSGMEPGSTVTLPAGTDVTFPDLPDQTGIGDILRHGVRSVAAGSGVPYELASGDLSQVSYASARVGMFAFQRRIAQLRMSVLGARLLAPVFRRFAMLEVLSGRIAAPGFERDPESWLTASFLWAGWPALNPYDEARADQIAIESGTRSRAEIIAGRGRSIQDVDAERALDPLKPSPRPALRLVESPENAA